MDNLENLSKQDLFEIIKVLQNNLEYCGKEKARMVRDKFELTQRIKELENAH